MKRTIVVTGSASGIGAATKTHLQSDGCTVLGVDLRNADICVDLATIEGRAELIERVEELAPAGIDGIVANAGVFRSDSLAVKVNYFGALATLEGLRPLLRGISPRAVVVSSRSLLQPVATGVMEACLQGDEELAVKRAEALVGQDRDSLYPTTKRAIATWLRTAAPSPNWAGAGIPLNAVAPGSVTTSMIARQTSEERALLLEACPMPLGGLAQPEEVASVIAWFLRPDNTKVTGQLVFVDGGGEAMMRVEDIWDGSLRSEAVVSALPGMEERTTL